MSSTAIGSPLATRSEARWRRVPAVVIAAGIAVWASAAADDPGPLVAEVRTTRGDFMIELSFDRAPMAVANFDALAGGRRWWLDPRDGRLRATPYYDGLPVDFAVTTGTESYFEFGSVDGSGAGDAGYEFRDELDSGLTHAPYVVTLAAPGPNGNGSRIRIFGGAAAAARNGRHTIIGRVPEGPGRAVVDAIIAAGAGGTIINVAEIPDRTGFEDDLAAVLATLPVLEPVSASLSVVPGESAALAFAQPAFSVFSAHASGDLLAWQPLLRRQLGNVIPDPQDWLVLDSALESRRFYHCSLASYPVVPAPPSGPTGFAGRTLTIGGPGIGTLIYAFNSSGDGGTYENVLAPGEPPFFSGPFTVVIDPMAAHFGPYSSRVMVNTPGLGGAAFQWIRTGWDEAGPSGPLGRHVTLLLSAAMVPVFEDAGTAGLTGP
jgi:cyclophilin family peptidyl-prolyl cis-trans isomerase